MEFVLAVQNLGGWLETPSHFFSLLGVEYFYLLVMPAILWCFDAGIGLRMGFILLASSLSNSVLKLAFGLPRPYWISARVQPYAVESSFGLPSGHAQNALSIWGRLGLALRRGWAIGAAIALTLLISLSRIFLGVHFPLDIGAGWLVGAILLALFLLLEGPCARGTARLTLAGQLMLVLAASLGTLWLGLAVWGRAAATPIPTDWLLATAAVDPQGELLDPRQVTPLFSLTGVILGFGAGAVLLRRWGRFSAKGKGWLRATRYAVGVFGVALIFVGLGALAPAGTTIGALVWRYLRYALVGIWISYLAPRLFHRLKLLPAAADSNFSS